MTASSERYHDPDRMGSRGSAEPLFLAVGRLRRAHGLRGEILMEVYTDFPERLRAGVIVYVGPDHKPMRITGKRAHTKGLLLLFEGFTSRETVRSLQNQWVSVRADDRPALPDGQYYHHELIGLRVVTEEGRYLGVLEEILETGANDVYLIRAEGREDILLPAIESVIQQVDLGNGEMRVHLLPGLISE